METPDVTLPGTPTERAERSAQQLFGEALPTVAQRKAEHKAAFVELITSGCNFAEAAEALGIDRSTAFRWRQQDADFAQACRDAFKASVDVLKREAERRAMKGSDKLLMFLLCNYAPEQFSNTQKVEHSGELSIAQAIVAARKRTSECPLV